MAMREGVKMGLKVALPVLIGLGVVAWLFHDDFNASTFSKIDITPLTVVCLAGACIFVAGRDFGLTWRYRVLSRGELSWRQALKVDLMCAFTSAITPSAVGGSAVGMIYMNQAGVRMGKAVMITMTTLFFDELILVLACPAVLLFFPYESLFGSLNVGMSIGIMIVFWGVYAGMLAWTLILLFGIILRPHGLRRVALRLFNWRLLRRWHPAVCELTDNMVATSDIIRKEPLSWWGKAFAGTVVSWASRFMVVNMLFLAFAPYAPQLLIFARQTILQIALTISPTPGASGISEWIFTEYFGDLLTGAGVALILAMIWRLLSYYLYLVAGVVLLPSYFKKKKNQTQTPG